jgi:acetyltransferase-like isoleucine patch superfamily enzyme
VRIGDGCIVGAGSVVAKDLDPWTVAVGNPARVIRERR